MNDDKMLDEIFQTFVNHLECVFLKKGAGYVNTRLSQYSDRDIMDLIWEVEEENDRIADRSEIQECFTEAMNYIDNLYCVRAQQAIEDGYAI